MPTRKFERILLLIVLALAAAVAADQVWNVAQRKRDEADQGARMLRAELDALKHGEADLDLQKRQIDALQERLRAAGTDRQNEFRRYLEDLVPQGGIVRVIPSPPAPMPERSDLQVLTFKLELRLKLRELLALLGRLDAATQPLKVNAMMVTPTEKVDETLKVDLTVSTLANTEARPS